MKRFLFILSVLPLLVSATMIQWYCAPGTPLQQADGSDLTAEFRFEMGVFKPGFSPTLANRADWSANWVPAQRAVYNETHQWYTGLFTVTENTGAFVKNADAWVWGFAGDAEAGEWILYRNTSWKWPKANARLPVPREWNAGKADVILAGSMTDGDNVLLQAEAVDGVLPPVTTWSQWVAETGSESPEADGKVPSILRYVLGAETVADLLARRMTLRSVQADGIQQMELTIPRRADRPATFRLEYSTDLEEWKPAPASLKLHKNGLSELVYREEVGVTSSRVFWRYTVTPR